MAEPQSIVDGLMRQQLYSQLQRFKQVLANQGLTPERLIAELRVGPHTERDLRRDPLLVTTATLDRGKLFAVPYVVDESCTEGVLRVVCEVGKL